MEAGAQSLFIDRNGVGNSHLNDQMLMHQSSESKKTVMAPDAVKASAVSTQELIYTRPRCDGLVGAPSGA